MTIALYKNIDGREITKKHLEDACSTASSTLSGALLILRVFAENGDEDTIDLCNALKALLLHVDRHIDDVRPWLS